MSIDTEVETDDLGSDKSMEETLRAGYKEYRAAGKLEEEPEAAPVEAKAEPVVEAKPDVPRETSSDRPRTPDGKFVKADAVKPEVAAAVTTEAPAKRRPPTTWRKEAIAKWDAIDPDIQAEIEKRENDARDGITLYKTKGEQAEVWDKALAPFQATIQSMGIPPQKAAQALFAADHAMRYGTPHQKAAMIHKLIKDYAIQLDGLPEPEQEDPRIAALNQRLEQQEQRWNHQEQQRQAGEMASAKAQLDEFRANAPHLDAVKEDMAVLLDTGRASNYQDAYDKAVWGKAELRTSLIAEQQKRQTEETARVASEARRAGSVNIPVKGKVAASAPKGSMEDDLKAGVKRLGLFN